MNRLTKEHFHGVIAPVPTPFTEDRQVDYDGLPALLNWLAQQKVHVLFLMGGSGEWETLEVHERRRIIDAAMMVSTGQIPVVPNVGCKSLGDTLELCNYAVRLGVPAVGVVIPDTLKPGQDSLYNYFASVARSCELPIMIYDPRGEGPLSPDPHTVLRMFEELDHIVAMKYRTTNAERMARMCMTVGERMSVLSGVETVFLSDLVYGARGVVGGGANIFPDIIYRIQEAFEMGDIDSARERQYRVIELNDRLSTIQWPLSGKIALKALGLPIALTTRVPVKTPRHETIRALEEAFATLEGTLRYEP